MQKLYTFLDELEGSIPHQSFTVTGVSSASVGWHIEHSLLVLDTSVKALHKSNPAEYKSAFSFWKTVTFLAGRFPRGRGKAPQVVQPTTDINEASLINHLMETKARINGLSSLTNRHFMKHPYFGHLKRSEAMRFMELHTAHHLKIIRDILKRHV
jgi:hypothetical protein